MSPCALSAPHPLHSLNRPDQPTPHRLYDVFEDPHNLYIVMEMCAGGELFERIQAKGSYSEYDASEVLRQMCTGIK